METTCIENKLSKLANENGIINALAIDQRGALKKMMSKLTAKVTRSQIEQFKMIVAEELTDYASAILLDPEYGLSASNRRQNDCGLLLAYEKTGYDPLQGGRLPDLIPKWSVLRLKEMGADACKFLLYYDVDEDEAVNEQKKVFVERIGAECQAVQMPLFLELLSYDKNISENNRQKYAKAKPKKVIKMMEEFSDNRYGATVLKVEVPVDMQFVEGHGSNKNECIYTQLEAAKYFEEQSNCSSLPFIFLSAGVSAKLFQETLNFAYSAHSKFSGVLCGRATWADAVKPFIVDGPNEARNFLKKAGKESMLTLGEILQKTATPWYERV